MCTDDSASIFSTKRLVLCSRENARRVAGRIFDEAQHACVIRTGHPLQPWRAAAMVSRSDEVETVLRA